MRMREYQQKRKLGVFQSYDKMNIDSYLHFNEEEKSMGRRQEKAKTRKNLCCATLKFEVSK